MCSVTKLMRTIADSPLVETNTRARASALWFKLFFGTLSGGRYHGLSR